MAVKAFFVMSVVVKRYKVGFYLHIDWMFSESIGRVTPVLQPGQMTALASEPFSVGSEQRMHEQSKNQTSEICFLRFRWPCSMCV